MEHEPKYRFQNIAIVVVTVSIAALISFWLFSGDGIDDPQDASVTAPPSFRGSDGATETPDATDIADDATQTTAEIIDVDPVSDDADQTTSDPTSTEDSAEVTEEPTEEATEEAVPEEPTDDAEITEEEEGWEDHDDEVRHQEDWMYFAMESADAIGTELRDETVEEREGRLQHIMFGDSDIPDGVMAQTGQGDYPEVYSKVTSTMGPEIVEDDSENGKVVVSLETISIGGIVLNDEGEVDVVNDLEATWKITLNVRDPESPKIISAVIS